MKSFAIVVVCYNRVEGLKLLLQSLKRVDFNNRKDITLIFSIDNSGSDLVEKYARSFEWEFGEKIVRTFEKRQGLKNHILKCGDYTNDYDIVTILEDDTIVSDSFYNYAYNAAQFYWYDDNIAGISLYTFEKNWLKWYLRFEPMKNQYDNYFLKVAQSWGQVWTKRKWTPFIQWLNENPEFKKSNDIPGCLNRWPDTSWLKFHDRYCIENNKYFVYPYYGLSSNTSAVGEHANISSNDYQVDMQFQKDNYNFQPFNSESIIYDEYMNREGLEGFLDLQKNEVFIDLYATRRITNERKYILTTKQLKKVKPIKSYRLFLRPIEASIINNISGDGIYLYETKDYLKYNRKQDSTDLLLYEFRTHDWKTLFKFAWVVLKKDFLFRIQRKNK